MEMKVCASLPLPGATPSEDVYRFVLTSYFTFTVCNQLDEMEQRAGVQKPWRNRRTALPQRAQSQLEALWHVRRTARRRRTHRVSRGSCRVASCVGTCSAQKAVLLQISLRL